MGKEARIKKARKGLGVKKTEVINRTFPYGTGEEVRAEISRRKTRKHGEAPVR